ncbi:hypothetical protein ERC79_16270 [Rhodococcus sp. ABRD24]|nr:hypothetical protein ERC79_16270 [Rhodococcus sp. ABRD24]
MTSVPGHHPYEADDDRLRSRGGRRRRRQTSGGRVVTDLSGLLPMGCLLGPTGLAQCAEL